MTVRRFAVLLVKNGLLAVALLVVATVSAVATLRVVLTSQEVVVPSLLERRVSEASAVTARHALLLKVEGKRNDPGVPPDRIVAQEPPPGSRLKTHRSVRVWLSLGPRRRVVPDVEGESLRTGRLILEQAELPVARIMEVNHPSAEGTILMQRPAAGETEAIGEGVSLLASRGPGATDYLMPDLIGRRADEVLEVMRRAGLKVADMRYRSYSGVAPGIVLRQHPAAGHRVSPRSAVSLDISRAAAP